MLAPPGRRLTDIVLAQLRSKHYPDTDALEHRRGQFSQLSPQTWWFGAPISYWQNLEARDELGIARRLDLRTLLVRGDRDENVSRDDLDRWVAALSPAKTCVLRIPGVNHLLVNSGPDDKPTTTVVDSTIIDNITDFIVLRPNAKASCLH
jgi:pimeloyl-ACP methyl ester carboxylesterase